MKFEIHDTNGNRWLSDDDTVSPEVLVQYEEMFTRGLGNLVLSADFDGHTRWFAPSHIVSVQVLLDEDEHKVLTAYKAAVAEAQQRAAAAEAAAEAAREAAEQARAGVLVPESALEHEVR